MSGSICSLSNRHLALIPLIPPLLLLCTLLDNPLLILHGWREKGLGSESAAPPVGTQLYAYLLVSGLGYVATNHLIPHIKQYTLRKGIAGKDLGKRGTSVADKDMYDSGKESIVEPWKSRLISHAIVSISPI